MNLLELKKELDILGVFENSYSLGNCFTNEQYRLEQLNNKWSVYYSERGERRGEKLFDTENDACQYFYTLLKRDTTVKNKTTSL